MVKEFKKLPLPESEEIFVCKEKFRGLLVNIGDFSSDFGGEAYNSDFFCLICCFFVASLFL
jgi:hypothetical protein